MFHRFQNVRTVAVVVGLLTALPGCHVLENCCHPEGEQFLGTVSTGGPLAASRTLPIPLDGLTLGEAVERSIRPGLLTATQAVTASAPMLPVAQQKVPPTIQLKAFVNGITQAVQNAPAGEVETKAAEAIATAVTQLTGLVPSKSAEMKKELSDRLHKSYHAGFFGKPQPSDLSTRAAQLYSDLQDILKVVPSNTPPLPVVVPSNAPGQIAVQLTRPAGNRIIVPLHMVRNYSPGDIWLTHGDRVQILPLAMTEAGQPLPNMESNTVSQFEIPQSSALNLLVLNHNSVVDGKREQYLLAANNPQYYGNAAFVQQWHREVHAHTGDHLGASNLELNPLIRRSRNNTIAASAAALQERANPPAVWKQQLHKHIERKTEFLCSLPGISHVRQQVEQQVGPISLPDTLKQTTGFDREEFCRQLTP